MITSIFLIVLTFTLFTIDCFPKEKVIVIKAIIPERIEFFAEDPPCQCLWTDYFTVRNIQNGKEIHFEDDDYKKFNKFYFVEREIESVDDSPYGSIIYRLKQQYRGKIFEVSYSRKLCKKYRECQMGKIYKNYIVSIK
ncbi:MAG: hypothetical protein ACO3AW_08605 [Chitinophagaceae bacterium]